MAPYLALSRISPPLEEGGGGSPHITQRKSSFGTRFDFSWVQITPSPPLPLRRVCTLSLPLVLFFVLFFLGRDEMGRGLRGWQLPKILREILGVLDTGTGLRSGWNLTERGSGGDPFGCPQDLPVGMDLSFLFFAPRSQLFAPRHQPRPPFFLLPCVVRAFGLQAQRVTDGHGALA